MERAVLQMKRGYSVYTEKIKSVPRIASRRDKFRERERYRRSFWGTIFLEIVLEKINEDEFFDMEWSDGEEEEEPRKKKASVPRIVDTAIKQRKREQQIDGKWLFPPKRESFQTEWESVLVWASGDWLELSLLPMDVPDISEDYSAAANMMRCIQAFSDHRIFYDSYEALRNYYDGFAETSYVERIFYLYCREYIEYGDAPKNPFRVYDVLSEVYEYFERANTRNAVRKNNEEGRRLAEGSGLPWMGSSYYNADYYYKCRRMRQAFRQICEGLAEEYGTDVPDFEEIEAETRFRMDGGLSFHSVWVWEQGRNNYPAKEYGMRRLEAEPPEGFLYYYRDYFNGGQYQAFEELKNGMRKLLSANPFDEREFYSFTMEEQDYHNGLSYLLDRNIGRENWDFLANFMLHRTAGCMEILCACDCRNQKELISL